jgi:hypothetical protein
VSDAAMLGKLTDRTARVHRDKGEGLLLLCGHSIPSFFVLVATSWQTLKQSASLF